VVGSPLRLLAWSLYLLWLLPSLVLRFVVYSQFGRGGYQLSQFLPSDLHLVAPGVVLLVAGVAMRIPCDRPPAVFSSAADGRFLCGSSISIRSLVLWLQLRSLMRVWVRIALFLGLQVVILASLLDSTGGWLVVATIFFGGGLLVLEGVKLPFFLLCLHHPRIPLRLITTGVAGIGATSLAVGVTELLGFSPPTWINTLFETAPLNGWGLLVLGGPKLAVGLIAGTLIALLVLGMAIGDDYLPELWAASIYTIAFRQSLRSGVLLNAQARRGLLKLARGREVKSRDSAVSLPGHNVPSGAWVIYWKRWVGLLRTPWGVRLPIGALLAAGLVGVVFGLLMNDHRLALVSSIVNVVGFWLVFGNLYASVNLAGDLGKPIWWLSAASLRSRLVAWASGRALVQWLLMVIIAVAAQVVSGFSTWPSVAAALGAALFVLCFLQILSLGAYTLLPAPVDLRGPGVVLRLMVAWGLAIPLLVAGVALGLVTRSLSAGFATAGILAVIQLVLMLEFASWRLAGNAFAFVRLERQ
jgi:hypothetical protein